MRRTPVISLGAGVQSTTLALMAAEGEFEVTPELAIFSDTEEEPRQVYEHLEWLTEELKGKIEVMLVGKGNLLEVATSRPFNPIPMYQAGQDGKASLGRRQCTREFKLDPIRKGMRKRLLNHVDCWIGISLDESLRMKPSGMHWVENRWPLIEKGMTRRDCERWLKDYGVPHEVPKSACVFCPFKSEHDFARMRDTDPESWDRAVRADERLRTTGTGGREQYVLASLIPLSELQTPEDRGQLTFDMDECEGMCGV